MVTFDSNTVTNILLTCVALTNLVIMAILYEKYIKKSSIDTKTKKK
jgi:hypothetical protein